MVPQGSAACPARARLVLNPVEAWPGILRRRSSVDLVRGQTTEKLISDLAPAIYSVAMEDLGDNCYSRVPPGSTSAAPPIPARSRLRLRAPVRFVAISTRAGSPLRTFR